MSRAHPIMAAVPTCENKRSGVIEYIRCKLPLVIDWGRSLAESREKIYTGNMEALRF
jgi:hypothetical protein